MLDIGYEILFLEISLGLLGGAAFYLGFTIFIVGLVLITDSFRSGQNDSSFFARALMPVAFVFIGYRLCYLPFRNGPSGMIEIMQETVNEISSVPAYSAAIVVTSIALQLVMNKYAMDAE